MERQQAINLFDGELSFAQLISSGNLDPAARSGRPNILTSEDIDHLVAVKRDFTTRRMSLVDLRREAGLSHVSDSTIWKALSFRGIKAYREQFKFILKEDNKRVRLIYCEERKDWKPDEEWAEYGFTE